MTDIPRYPLSWPTGWTRTPYSQRKRAAFSKKGGTNDYGFKPTQKLTVGDGLERLHGELRRLGAQRVIISSNLRIREDGLPYAQQAKQLDDPGVAVYFQLKGKPRALACDKWTSAADNMAAIAGHISAIRTVDRYGVGTIEQAFAGYAALPPSADDWRSVFGLNGHSTMADVEAKFRALAIEHHPDRGGDPSMMSRINAARDAARKELV